MTGLVLVGKLTFGSGVPGGFVLVGAEHVEGFLCGRSRNSRWLRSRNSAVGGSVLMFYSLASFGVEVARPGRMLGR